MWKKAKWMNESKGEFCPVQKKSAEFSLEMMKRVTGHYYDITHTEKRSFAAETSVGRGVESPSFQVRASSSALASCKSAVSNPSVNQL